MSENDCLDDALLLAVVEQAQKVRHTLRSLADDPEANWLDGYLAGWFDCYFHTRDEENHGTSPRSNALIS